MAHLSFLLPSSVLIIFCPQTYFGSEFPKVLTNHSGASLQRHRTVRNDVEATYIFLIASRYNLPKGVEFRFQRQIGRYTVKVNLELSQQ